MFRGSEALAAVADDVAVAATGEAIAEARRQIDRLQAAVAAAEAKYVTNGGFEVDGYGSMGAFLRLRCHMTVPESRRVTSRATKLAAWPEVTDAWVSGELKGAQVDLVCAKVPRRHIERFAETADGIVERVASLSPTRSAMRSTCGSATLTT